MARPPAGHDVGGRFLRPGGTPRPFPMLERDECALVGERPRDGRSGTASGACDEDDSLAQAEIHVRLPAADDPGG